MGLPSKNETSNTILSASYRREDKQPSGSSTHSHQHGQENETENLTHQLNGEHVAENHTWSDGNSSHHRVLPSRQRSTSTTPHLPVNKASSPTAVPAASASTEHPPPSSGSPPQARPPLSPAILALAASSLSSSPVSVRALNHRKGSTPSPPLSSSTSPPSSLLATSPPSPRASGLHQRSGTTTEVHFHNSRPHSRRLTPPFASVSSPCIPTSSRLNNPSSLATSSTITTTSSPPCPAVPPPPPVSLATRRITPPVPPPVCRNYIPALPKPPPAENTTPRRTTPPSSSLSAILNIVSSSSPPSPLPPSPPTPHATPPAPRKTTPAFKGKMHLPPPPSSPSFSPHQLSSSTTTVDPSTNETPPEQDNVQSSTSGIYLAKPRKHSAKRLQPLLPLATHQDAHPDADVEKSPRADNEQNQDGKKLRQSRDGTEGTNVSLGWVSPLQKQYSVHHLNPQKSRLPLERPSASMQKLMELQEKVKLQRSHTVMVTNLFSSLFHLLL